MTAEGPYKQRNSTGFTRSTAVDTCLLGPMSMHRPPIFNTVLWLCRCADRGYGTPKRKGDTTIAFDPVKAKCSDIGSPTINGYRAHVKQNGPNPTAISPLIQDKSIFSSTHPLEADESLE